MKKKRTPAGILAIAALLAIGVVSHFTEDMSYASWTEIEAYQQQHPHVVVTYQRTIDKGITLSRWSRTVTLQNAGQIDKLIHLAYYFQQLETISLDAFSPTADELCCLQQAFPDAALQYTAVSVQGRDYPADAVTLDLYDLTIDTAPGMAEALAYFPNLQTVDLNGGSSLSPVPVKAVGYLASARPELDYLYATELFGQIISTDMERVEYFQVDIGDKGLEQFRYILPIMHNLTYFKLDWCGTTDEIMAALRDEYQDHFKVVWRVFTRTKNEEFNMLTDTYKVYMQWDVYDSNTEILKYCTEVRYLDIGHSEITHCDFVAYMPHLDTLIMSISQLRDIDALATCKNLTFLEMFMTKVRDLSPLAELNKLEYLNIGDIRTDDFTPLFGLKQLRKLHSVKNYIPEEMAEATRKALPNTNVIITDEGDWVWSYKWRQGRETPDSPYGWMPRYALLRKQIGYDTMDYSRYPGGYVTEEITYESTGIKPPINNE